MHKVSNSSYIYAMSAKIEPVLRVDAGAQVEFETMDALQGQIKDEKKGFEGLDWKRVNPATGPVYINGAEPGDVLSVKIDSIEVADSGVVICGQGMGVLGNVLKGNATKVVPIKDGYAIYSDKIKLPLNKMIGVIGVAPKDGEIPCGAPDMHGGNMDCKEIKEGTTLLLPVFVPGALLALGDLHAVMADGEIGVAGLELPGKVVVTIDLIKGKNYPLPMICSADHVMTLASDVDLDIAVDMAVANMVKYLAAYQGFSEHDATMLTSMAADVRICQVVDPKKTIRVEFPRKYLSGCPCK